MSVKIAAVGDAMLVKDFPTDYNLREVADILGKAQVKAVNVEMVLSNRDCFASTFCGGQWVHSDSENFSNLLKYGFNLFSCANNHSMDYSFDGVLETIKTVGKVGEAAGIGKDLSDATKPCYITVKDGNKDIRVALVSLTTTFIDAARAGYANKYFPGRPGVSVLRHKEVFYCTQEQMNVLRTLASDTHINGERDNARKIGSLPPEEEGTFNFGGIFFKVSDKKGKNTTCHEGDLKRILDSIKEAKANADYVIVMPHSHNIKHSSYTEPDYFFEDFCRKCIDSGADCIFGGGTHQLKPIEIYHEKPIFYSLGNFIFQIQLIDVLPQDFWEKYNYSPNLSVQEAMAIKTKNGTIGLETDRHNYLSVIPIVEFESGKLKDINLNVISLQFDKDSEYKGLPVLANEEETEYVLKYLHKINIGGGVPLREKMVKLRLIYKRVA